MLEYLYHKLMQTLQKKKRMSLKSTHDPHLSSLLFVYPVPNQLRKKRIDWNKLDFCFLYKKKGGWKIQKSERPMARSPLFFTEKSLLF